MPQPSNVLILKSDEHSPRIASVYGHPFIETPNMDRLAARGTTYESAYCPSPLCCPSRSSFISGRPVHEIQCYNNSMVVERPNFPSYGSILAQQGVYTVHAGRVDAYRPADELGFTEMLGKEFRGTGDISIARQPLALRPTADIAKRLEEVGASDRAFRTDDPAMEKALAFVDKTKTLDQPWTMEVNLLAPHFPHQATQELWDLYDGHDDLPEYGPEEPSAQHPYAEDLRRHFATHMFTEELIRQHRRGYYARVSYVDAQLGLLMDKLEETGQLENTVVAYTSDHGEMLGKFGMWYKSSMFDDSARIPLVVAGPGFAAGARSSTAVTQWDLQASIFAAVGGSRPSELAGAPLQHIGLDDDGRAAFSEYHGHGTRGSAYLVRQGPWKLVYNALAPHQLFNLDDDPDELVNFADAEPTRVKELTDRLYAEFCDPEREQERAEEFIKGQLDAHQGSDRG